MGRKLRKGHITQASTFAILLITAKPLQCNKGINHNLNSTKEVHYTPALFGWIKKNRSEEILITNSSSYIKMHIKE